MSRSLAEYRRVTKSHITGLQTALDKASFQVGQLEARAELAERKERQIAADRDIWKHRALEAETALKSLGARS